MPGLEDFREVQYYAMMKDYFGSMHVVAKTAYGTNCVCKECNHAWRGECMQAKCACCTSAAPP